MESALSGLTLCRSQPSALQYPLGRGGSLGACEMLLCHPHVGTQGRCCRSLVVTCAEQVYGSAPATPRLLQHQSQRRFAVCRLKHK